MPESMKRKVGEGKRKGLQSLYCFPYRRSGSVEEKPHVAVFLPVFVELAWRHSRSVSQFLSFSTEEDSRKR